MLDSLCLKWPQRALPGGDAREKTEPGLAASAGFPGGPPHVPQVEPLPVGGSGCSPGCKDTAAFSPSADVEDESRGESNSQQHLYHHPVVELTSYPGLLIQLLNLHTEGPVNVEGTWASVGRTLTRRPFQEPPSVGFGNLEFSVEHRFKTFYRQRSHQKSTK